jgi:two-component system NtrC family sensor kinase
MKKYILFLILVFSMQYASLAQTQEIDSLKNAIAIAKQDTSRVRLLYQLIGSYRFNRPDSAIYYGIKALALARKINFPVGEVALMRYIAVSHITLGNYSKAMQLDLEAIRLAEENGLLFDKIVLLGHIGSIYLNSGDFSEALRYYRASASLADSARSHNWIARGLDYIGLTYRRMGRIDSAKFYATRAQDYCIAHPEISKPVISGIITNLGKIYHLEGKREMALSYFRQGLFLSSESRRFQFLALFPFAEFYFEANELDSSAYYATKSLDIALEGNLYSYIVKSSKLLSAIYKKNGCNKGIGV